MDYLILASIIIVLILGGILFYLNTTKKKLEKTIHETDKMIVYKTELQKIRAKQQTSKKALEDMNKVIREFLKKEHKIKDNLEYSEIKTKFTKKKDKPIAEFCQFMEDLVYSGKKITHEDVAEVYMQFSKILLFL